MSTIQNTSVVNLFRLDGKTAIVTGATGGIGLVLTLALAESGADIVSIQLPNDPGSQTLKEKVEKLGRHCQQFESNLGDYKSIPNVFTEIWRSGVEPDILLHCAGITRHSRVEDTPLDYLDNV